MLTGVAVSVQSWLCSLVPTKTIEVLPEAIQACTACCHMCAFDGKKLEPVGARERLLWNDDSRMEIESSNCADL
jgi:hypothetical protein